MSLPSPTTGKGFTALDPAQQDLLDAPLIALANKSGGDLRNLLFAFFSFLHRRTDFYMVPHEEVVEEGVPLKMGFREGDAEKVLIAAFRQFPLRRIPKQTHKDGDKIEGDSASSTDFAISSPGGSSLREHSKGSPPTSVHGDDKLTSLSKIQSRKGDEKPRNKEPSAKTTSAAPLLTDSGKQIPIGNGGSTKTYTWTQTLDETSVLIAVPEGTKGKDLDVVFKASSISVRTRKNAAAGYGCVLVKGELVDKIRPDESTWSLEGGVLVLTLDKGKKTWWESVLVGDDIIDTSLVDSRRRIEEYDESTQAAIRKVIFDQHQEQVGLPTSDAILGEKLHIPPLPPGVEYIDKSTLDNYDKTV